MCVRLATETDAAALIALDSVAEDEPQRAAQIRTWCAQSVCYLAEERGVVMGYGVLHYHFFGCGFVEMLMVGASWRRRGLGAALIAHFQSMSSGVKLFSSTNMSNRPMQDLLVKAGFRPSGYIDNLDENDPEIVFYSPSGPTVS